MGGCQNYGRFLGALNIGSQIAIGIQRGTIILTTTHIRFFISSPRASHLGNADMLAGKKFIGS